MVRRPDSSVGSAWPVYTSLRPNRNWRVRQLDHQTILDQQKTTRPPGHRITGPRQTTSRPLDHRQTTSDHRDTGPPDHVRPPADHVSPPGRRTTAPDHVRPPADQQTTGTPDHRTTSDHQQTTSDHRDGGRRRLDGARAEPSTATCTRRPTSESAAFLSKVIALGESNPLRSATAAAVAAVAPRGTPGQRTPRWGRRLSLLSPRCYKNKRAVWESRKNGRTRQADLAGWLATDK